MSEMIDQAIQALIRENVERELRNYRDIAIADFETANGSDTKTCQIVRKSFLTVDEYMRRVHDMHF
jgi:hypothetical protein